MKRHPNMIVNQIRLMHLRRLLTQVEGAYTCAVTYLLLFLLMLLSAYIVLKGITDIRALERARTTKQRQAIYRGLLHKTFLQIGLPGIFVLVITNKLRFFVESLWVNARSNSDYAFFHNLTLGQGLFFIVKIFLLMSLVQGIMTIVKTIKTKKLGIVIAGNVQALIPRNKRERVYGALLAIEAGINEEILFRLAIPALLLSVIPVPTIAFILTVIWFGLMHWYQGVVGIVGTAILGALLLNLYLVSGNIFYAIAVHIIIDLQGLVLQPLISQQTLRFFPKKAS